MLVNDAVSRFETVILGCKCTIRYSGRAESMLAEGDRIILIKSDGALVVHQPFGNAPINYMKPASSHVLDIQQGVCTLTSRNISDKESMYIRISHVLFFNNYKLIDNSRIIVAGTEEDMANMIMQHPENIESGFHPVSQEEQTKYGFIDVLGTDKNGALTVVECKRYVADLAAVTQLRRYVEKISVSKGITNVRGIIAAPSITDNAKRMLEDWGFSFVSVKPPRFLEEFDKKQQRLDTF